MDIWKLIETDHANITDLGRLLLRSTGEGVRDRDRLFAELDLALKRHLEAEEGSLYEALEDDERLGPSIRELTKEHAQIRAGLDALAEGDKDGREWTDRFEDFTYLLDRHFHVEQHELLPAAREALAGRDLQELRHEFAEEKIEALRAARRWDRGFPYGLVLGSLAGAAVVALAAVAWRGGARPTQFVPRRSMLRQLLPSTDPASRSGTRDAAGLGTILSLVNDSIEGYRAAAGIVVNAELEARFEQLCQRRERVRDALRAKLLEVGGEPTESGTVSGAAHRAFLNVRALVQDDKKAAAAEVQRGERMLTESFEAMLADGDVSPKLVPFVRQQQAVVAGDLRQVDELANLLGA